MNIVIAIIILLYTVALIIKGGGVPSGDMEV